MRIASILAIIIFAASTLQASERATFGLTGSPVQDTTAASGKAAKDTTRSQSAIDTVVTYSAADSIVYSIANREMFLYKKGNMKYRDFKLDAGQIGINWTTAILNAEGVKDTADKIIEKPVFTEAGETYDGSHVAYDFKSQKGRITLANTDIDNSYYHGKLIKKYAKNAMYIENGRFTTCDNTPPDYYFQSSKMKLVINKTIIAEPIIMYVDGVPVFAIPFGVFPAKSGRRSGIITPSFGETANAGRYLSHLGYFWAINDYSDLTTTLDWYTRGGYDVRSGLRYALRYYFNGSLYGAYSYRYNGEPGDPGRTVQKNWDLQFTHDQTIDPSTRIVANVSMSSSNYFRTTSIDYGQILQQNLVSDVTLFKTWEGSGNSFSINIHRDQNLGTGSISSSLPNLTLSHSQSYPFRSAAHENASPNQLAWYELIGYSYNGQFLNNSSKIVDTTNHTVTKTSSYGAQHSISISAAPKAGYFTISPFMSVTDKMYGVRTVYGDVPNAEGEDSVFTRPQHGFYNVGYFNTGVSASTRLFGLVAPHMFGIAAFRHTFQPSLTFSYQPDFSQPFWRYYGHYDSLDGQSVKYDYYSSSAFGGAPAGTFAGLQLSINNNFEMKTMPSDTSQVEKKYQLLNLGLGLSYNFAAKGQTLPLSELSVNYRTNVGGKVDIGGNSSFNFYQYDAALERRVNRFLWSDGELPDMTNFSLSISTTLQGKSTKREETNQTPTQQSDSVKATQQYDAFYNETPRPNLNIPWNLDLGFNYGITKPYPGSFNTYATVSYNLGFNLTKNWKIGFTGGYDFIAHQMTIPTVTVYRDLHCWEMNLTWNPIGYYRGFNLVIRIKASQLRDIKITKREDTIVGY